MSALKYWVWLSSLGGVGPVTALQLLRHFETPEKIFLASADEYRDIDGIRSADISALSRKDIESANKILSSCSAMGYRIVTLQDAEYPDRLRNIYDPPVTLYIKGSLPVVDDEAVVAIVGTRGCTPYGINAAENIGYCLARRGLIVVTGLARGIDSAATRGALRGGGRVLGVIGSGLDVVYPRENKTLFEDVAAAGAIISEYPPGSPAAAAHFPARNRILSGLSLGVTVIEAPKKSGALITAARALEQGRDVFALPGNVDARSCEGSNALLRDGAIPVLSGEDIVGEYAGLFPEKIRLDGQEHSVSHDRKSADRPGISQAGNGEGNRGDNKKEVDNTSKVDYIDIYTLLSTLTGDEKTIASAIGTGTISVDDMIVGTGLSAQQVLTALTMLEIKGCVVRGSGKYYSLAQPDKF